MIEKRLIRLPKILVIVCSMEIFFMGCSSFRNIIGGVPQDPTPTQEDARIISAATGFFSNVRPYRESTESMLNRGCYFQENGKYRLAIQEFRGIVEMNPTSVEAYNRMGICYDLLGEYDQAVYCYMRALGIEHDLAYVQNNLGYSYFLQGSFDYAVAAFKKAIALNAHEALYHNNLGLAYAGKGEFRLAFQELELGGDKTKAHYNLKQIVSRMNLDSQGKANLEQAKRAIQPFPRNDLLSANSVVSDAVYLHSPAGLPSEFADTSADEQILSVGTVISRTYENSFGIKTNEPGIEVSNGNGVRFMARDVARYLENRGSNVQKLSNAQSFSHRKSTLYYCDGYLEQAHRIAEELPGLNDLRAVRLFRRPDIKIRVVIGRDLIPFKAVFEHR